MVKTKNGIKLHIFDVMYYNPGYRQNTTSFNDLDNYIHKCGYSTRHRNSYGPSPASLVATIFRGTGLSFGSSLMRLIAPVNRLRWFVRRDGLLWCHRRTIRFCGRYHWYWLTWYYFQIRSHPAINIQSTIKLVKGKSPVHIRIRATKPLPILLSLPHHNIH